MIPSKIFFIGPGGVGKTTCGKLLSNKLEYNFIDLDSYFLQRYGNIGEIIEKRGYESYCRLNSDLFFNIIEDLKRKSIVVLSSGFMAYEDELVAKHRQAIENNGITSLERYKY